MYISKNEELCAKFDIDKVNHRGLGWKYPQQTRNMHPKLGTSISIYRQVESDETSIFYAFSHWESQSFAIATNRIYLLMRSVAPVCEGDVVQGYFSVNSDNEMVFSDMPRVGWGKVTYVCWHSQG